ncbi:MAG: RNA recognition motif domain-containing protein [Gammaproteobacteria bacterium]
MKLLIRNIDRSVTEAQIRSLFEAYGTIQSCNIVLDKQTGESKGFGFVEMPKSGEAKAATKNLNGKDIQGSKIRVKKAETRIEKTPNTEKPNPYNKSK